MVLQNAIEDVGYINDMPVRPISLSSPDVPEQPVNVTATALSATKIKVDWSKLNYNHPTYYIVGYTVFFKEFGDDNPWMSKTIMVRTFISCYRILTVEDSLFRKKT